ncbi:hypothetical protein [Clostridium manihotivorum]|uniref:ABC-2 family transporter protein n=1 Tax=Clostridium manihotivorum TaxID=2320868 RepID=A0A410DVA7_9CLOT|nr:hypothetical protein [Clostridium manihotivorum]QAA32902.1 hypothetical protein C1I91_15345 [Clostridium manihotivorum]
MVIRLNKIRLFKNYFNYNIINKITLSALFILFLYLFGEFIDFLKNFAGYKDVSVYDYMIFLFNQYIFLVFFLDLFFLAIIKNFISKNSFSKYLILKFSNRKQLFINNIVAIAITSFLYVLIAVLIVIIQGGFNLRVSNNWTTVSSLSAKITQTEVSGYFKAVSPLVACLLNYLLTSLYILFIGIVFYVSSLYFRKTIIPFVISIGFIVIGVTAYTGSVQSAVKFSLCENAMIYSQVWASTNFLYQIGFKLIFWLITISALIALGLYRVKRVDFKFEGEK